MLARLFLALALDAATVLASRKSSETQMQASKLALRRLVQPLLVPVLQTSLAERSAALIRI